MALRIAEAQQLYDAVTDPLCKPALVECFNVMRARSLDSLLDAVRRDERDTLKEARLAGMVEAYETAMDDIALFAEKQLREATQ